MTTPNNATAALVTAYARDQVANLGDNDQAPLLAAILESQSDQEACALGLALLARNDSLADPPFRTDGEMCDPQLREIAVRLGYSR